jgi:uncharacterized membrane protein
MNISFFAHFHIFSLVKLSSSSSSSSLFLYIFGVIIIIIIICIHVGSRNNGRGWFVVLPIATVPVSATIATSPLVATTIPIIATKTALSLMQTLQKNNLLSSD